jgi:serine kinase of HPr protein (carbohydrate metabolism regulator)
MELIHASCVAIGDKAVLIAGRSGTGKSDLALRLIDRGASLVSDDYTELEVSGGDLLASPPGTIAGKIEVRGVGIVEMDYRDGVPVHLHIDLDAAAERLPEARTIALAGVAVRSLALNAFEASAAIKVELAMREAR